MVLIVERIADHPHGVAPIITEPTVTPEDTLRDVGIDDARQAEYQRKLSTVLAGRRVGETERAN
jgi:hypothetical protein